MTINTNKKKLIVLSILIVFSASLQGQTWTLRDDSVSETAQNDRFHLRVSNIKHLVNTGQTKEVIRKIDQLKKDFPDLTGPDLDIFLDAELLLSKRKLTRAAQTYDKMLDNYPQSGFYEPALSRQFQIASAYLAGQKKRVLLLFKLRSYEEGEELMDRIADRVGDSPIAIKALSLVAQSSEDRELYNEAYFQWAEIYHRWPLGQTGDDALLGMARSKYKSYKGDRYDTSGLISARTYFQLYKQRFPEKAKQLEIDSVLVQIEEDLAANALETAEFYNRTKKKQAANLYYQMVIDRWPDTKAAETARQNLSGESK